MADNNDSAAMVHAAAARALIRAMGMQAANAGDAVNGRPPFYSEDDFKALIDDEGIGHNDVVGAFRG